jgi:hypothetical protein
MMPINLRKVPLYVRRERSYSMQCRNSFTVESSDCGTILHAVRSRVRDPMR